MATQVEEQSPLIAALPPETDYITYLTILEYQLTPSNLSTLTSLLTDDDGTLAKEIGWDLVKLVLKLSEQAPQEAARCLEAVARRGNPREVVIVIPEQLQQLHERSVGNASNPDQEFEDSQDDDGLRTFEGEAPRIHLGTMILDGMPPPSDTIPSNETVKPDGNEDSQHPELTDPAQTKFNIILRMLSILHPRIQTKHPSRLLATSLPAALGAYRRIPINATTTTAFVSLLEKLSGKQRPALPPRTSTAGAAEIVPNEATSSETKSAPLPDPEAENGTAGTSALSADEINIVQRLLQAVLLEVFEEYIVSLATQEPSSMSWTARLRENREPKRVVPNRETATEIWKTDQALQERDTLIARFTQLSKDLGLDEEITYSQAHILDTVSEAADFEAAAEDPGSPPDYPTSPEQIPFPKTGTILIFIAAYFVPALAVPVSHTDGTAAHQEFLHQTFLLTGIEDPSNHPALCSLSTPVLDFLLAVLYTAARANCTPHTLIILLFLTSLCSDNSDPYIRDSAHAIATIFYHQSPSVVKLGLVRHMVINSQNQHLRAVAVNWLKDSIAQPEPSTLETENLTRNAETAYAICEIAHRVDSSAQHNLIRNRELKKLIDNGAFAQQAPAASHLHPDILTTDAKLSDALCALPRTGELEIRLPFYIAILNLLTIAPTEKGGKLIDSLTRLRKSVSDDDANDIPLVDLWSFDDALQRAKGVFEKEDASHASRVDTKS